MVIFVFKIKLKHSYPVSRPFNHNFVQSEVTLIGEHTLIALLNVEVEPRNDQGPVTILSPLTVGMTVLDLDLEKRKNREIATIKTVQVLN